jgi:hypothetical protein
MEVLFCSSIFFFDPFLALDDVAMRRACWGVFSLVTSFYEMTERSSQTSR